MADVSVRPARTGDVAELARIQRDTLVLAYAGALPTQFFARLADPNVQAEQVTGIAGQISGDGSVFVALEGDQLVGLAFARRADGEVLEAADPDPSATGFLEQILVEPRWGHRGHGSRLLAAVIESFIDASFTRAIAWVPESNPATLGLLTSAGWERDGYVRGLDTGAATLREVRLHVAF